MMHRHRVGVAVGLDGSPTAHDRHRRFANDPVETYEALLDFAPPRVDFLLPHGTWEHPPPGLEHRRVPPTRAPVGTPHNEPTPYGDRLIGAFDRWLDAPARETRVRMFEEVMSGVLGGPVYTKALGLAPVDLVVVEADGTMERSDSLKVVEQSDSLEVVRSGPTGTHLRPLLAAYGVWRVG
ncbi:hypothetical protein PV416_42915 [Streptomyces ipomoeae]|uniref:hypothetical protein n=1 Tax=Streptomyces ipomoeae TaxID=103232 RepID=UPI0029A56C16|nr:hypothetical protein [Streptomyces ipomoeae]MDX2827634.1 hypothetical protein [Streptomyces ipomoeae]MDX2880189.1 hypothetical protein [Streptomyces ipomoeae]